MTRRMTITVLNNSADETWLYHSSDLEHGKWMKDSPPNSVHPNSTAIVQSEKTSGSLYGTTGQISFTSSKKPGSTLTINWNKPYGTDPTTCTVNLDGVDYVAVIKDEDFQESTATCTVAISNNTNTHLIDTNNWMGKLPANTLLNNIMLPGSHDAGMSELNHCSVGADDSNTQTQKLNIEGQLKAGSRYFDIRVDYDHNELVTFHRTSFAGCNGQDFRTVLDQTIAFLRTNPSEVVIHKISHIRDDKKDTKSRIKNMLINSPYKEFLFTATNENLAYLNLTEAAGKIVAVLDYDYDINPSKGMFRFRDGFQEVKKNQFVCDYRDLNLTVCDLYAKESSYDKMAADQIKKWDQYAGLKQKYLFLLSWTITVGATGSIKDAAKIANGNLPEVLRQQIKEKNKPFPNIVYLDFIDVDITRVIIGYNF